MFYRRLGFGLLLYLGVVVPTYSFITIPTPPPRSRLSVTTWLWSSDPSSGGPEGINNNNNPYSKSQWLDLMQSEGGEVSDNYEQELTDQAAAIEYFGDEELLAKYRQERQASNDQWQFNQLVGEHQGTWSGIWSDFVPLDDVDQPLEGGRRRANFKLVSIHRGRHKFWADVEGRKLGWIDEVIGQDLSGRLSEPVEVDRTELEPHHLRAVSGNMAVGGAFTRCRTAVSERGEDMIAPEIWVADKGTRMRCRFIYCAPKGGDTFKLQKLVVMKEREGVRDLSCEEPALWGAEGHKIYDPVNVGPRDWKFATSGRLCLSFPATIGRDQPGTVIMDWEAGDMRYQADRKFKLPDGTLDTLELTEIKAEDSRVYTF